MPEPQGDSLESAAAERDGVRAPASLGPTPVAGSDGARGAADPLGPFAPPADYAFEPELAGPPPRPIPASVRNGPYARRQRSIGNALLFFAAFCATTANTGPVERLAQYLLPLGYLVWIAGLLAVLGAVVHAHAALGFGPVRFVRSGAATVARVRSLAVRARPQGKTTVYDLAGEVEAVDPATGALRRVAVASERALGRPSGWDGRRIAAGEYATVVWLPGKELAGARLYPLLELTDASTVLPRRPTGIVPTIAAVAAVLGVIGGLVYAIEFTWPEDLTASFAWAGLALAVTVAAPLWLVAKRRARETGALAAIGLLIAGGFGAAAALSIANAALDRSPPRYEVVTIVEFWQETTDGILRDYSIEYQDPRDGHTRRLKTTPEQMARFQFKAGATERHAGAFGWPWVRTMHPVLGRRGTLVEIELDDGRTAVVETR